MGLTTQKMGLFVWDELDDPYDNAQLANNFGKLDFHDHTPGRGVQIPTEGIFDEAITIEKMAPDTVGRLSPWTVYHTNTDTASNALFNMGYTGTNAVGIADHDGFYIDPSDFKVNGQLRFRFRVFFVGSNTGSPSGWRGGDITIGLLRQPTDGSAASTTILYPMTLTSPDPSVVNYSAAALSSTFQIATPGLYFFAYKTQNSWSVVGSPPALSIQLQMAAK